jgi:hypothetical protein
MGPARTVLTPLRGYVLRSPIEPRGWRRGLQSAAPPGLRSCGPESVGASAERARGSATNPARCAVAAARCNSARRARAVPARLLTYNTPLPELTANGPTCAGPGDA